MAKLKPECDGIPSNLFQEPLPCLRCLGKGSVSDYENRCGIDADAFVCSCCQGTGTKQTVLQNNAPVPADCPNCQGTGYDKGTKCQCQED